MRRARGPGTLGRDFTLLCAGQAVSQLGSRGYGVAIALWILSATGSAATVGLVTSVTLGVFAATQVPAGWIVDRCDRRHVMLACDITSAVAVGSLALVPFALPHVLFAAGALAVGWAVRGTAETAALPNVVPDDRLEDAYAVVQGRGYATGIAGPLLAGSLFVVAPGLPFLFDACSYLVAGACAAAVRGRLRAAGSSTTRRLGVLDGCRTICRHRFLRLSTLIAAVTGFAASSSSLVMVVVLQHEGVTPTTIGSAFTATYVGGLVGAVATRIVGRRLPAQQLLVIGLATAVLAVSLMLLGTPAAVFVTCVLLTTSRPLWWIPVAASWTRLVPDEVRGRADGVVGLVVAAAAATAPSITGALLEVTTPGRIGLLLTVMVSGTAMITVVGLRRSHWPAARDRAPAAAPARDVPAET